MERIRNSLVLKEIEAIIAGGEKAVHFAFTAELFAGGKKVRVHRVDFITIDGDYANDYQDHITASFKVEPSIYQTLVYPNRNDLTIHLKRVGLRENGGGSLDGPSAIEELRGYLVNPVNLVKNQNVEVLEGDLDMMGFMDLPIQMTDPFANKIRLYQVGGNKRGMVPGDVLKQVLKKAIDDNQVKGRVIPAKISMVTPDNRKPRENIVIPHGKELQDLPHYLQDYQGGIYNAGIRMYYQRGTFFIWPKYYLGDRPGQRKVLTIFNVPPNQFPGAERTYRETDYQVLVISTGESRSGDSSMDVELNEGNGIRFTSTDALLGGMIETSGNRATARRGFANSEFIDGETGRGENFAPVSTRRITDNPYAEVSALAKRKGMFELYVWENANPYIVYPGMDVKVITMEEGKLVERTGSLIGSKFHFGPKNDNFMNSHLVITGGLNVFVNKQGRVIG